MRCFYRRGNLSGAAALGGPVAICGDTGGVGRQSGKAPGENCSQWRCYSALHAPWDRKVTKEEPCCQMLASQNHWMVEVGGNLSSHTLPLFPLLQQHVARYFMINFTIAPGNNKSVKQTLQTWCAFHLFWAVPSLWRISRFTFLLQSFAWAPFVLKAALLNTRLSSEGITCLPLGSSKWLGKYVLSLQWPSHLFMCVY